MSMPPKKTARAVATDAEIEAAVAEANALEDSRVAVVHAECREEGDIVFVELSTGVGVTLPRRLLQGLESATDAQLRHIRIVGAASGISWPDLNVDHSVTGLIAGIFGSRAWMAELARRAGSVTSAGKAAAARENGRKGGRPRTRRTTAT